VQTTPSATFPVDAGHALCRGSSHSAEAARDENAPLPTEI